LPVRHRILVLLVVMSFVNYLLRNNLSIALPSIRQEFALSSTDLGWILGGFNFAYALLQIPGGIFGELYGSRRALAIICVCWGVLTFLTGFMPALLAASATGAIVSLVVVRFLLGVTNAPVYPAMGGCIASWYPVGSWAFPNSASSAGATLGQAALGPVVTLLIIQFGWRESFYALAPLGVLMGAWWYWYGRDKPAEHPAVTPQELEVIERGREALHVQTNSPQQWRLALVRRDVLLLACAYFCMNYVFYMFSNWLFTYLVEARRFSQLEGGVLSALPFVCGGVGAVVGGIICDALCQRIGPRWGCRLPAIIALILVAVFLLAGAYAPNPYVAVILLSLCFGFAASTEGPFWSATTYAADPHAAAATGVLNTGGNAPGFLAPVVGVMIDHWGWLPTLASGSAFAILGAMLWLFVGVQRDEKHAMAAVPREA